jgi:hypothetical protein
MRQPAGAAERFRIILRHGPVADVLTVVVATQAIGLILATRSFIAPQAILILLNCSHEVPVGQVGKRVAAVETADILEENEMLAMCAMKGLHVAPRFEPMAYLEAQLALARKTRA